ncbi:hypothetical protein JX265_010240 [Neoarthrinium moseri]|uniref:Uncharacterized protein n=1 Tax=Neoarthrinium moseri TaxID=1658444 RepID=A0A9P9WET8_9PEZI|nr:uncharacterized protein JN550_010480 [Neoarthrinium moseri]KAI1844331.1 hypothetical protein JX266_009425 [Neoarthrinium moseri]KAI1859791.1 hypothetical protein JX265_010240 [Neoarthrinium moseri]KAI1862177.1 hypothetical protein JN550_010480 [Neoarthrinium moseri]
MRLKGPIASNPGVSASTCAILRRWLGDQATARIWSPRKSDARICEDEGDSNIASRTRLCDRTKGGLTARDGMAFSHPASDG